MEFWGAEVKVGETIKIDPYDHFNVAAIHLTQVALGETNKDEPIEYVVIYLKFGNQKHVLGTLSRDKITQISLDLPMEKEFELSHNSKATSVYFCGYKAIYDEDGEDISLSTKELNEPKEEKDEPKEEKDEPKEEKDEDSDEDSDDDSDEKFVREVLPEDTKPKPRKPPSQGDSL